MNFFFKHSVSSLKIVFEAFVIMDEAEEVRITHVVMVDELYVDNVVVLNILFYFLFCSFVGIISSTTWEVLSF